MKPIKVLYIHHFGGFGGASRSLLELIQAFPRDEIEPLAIVTEGSVTKYFNQVCSEIISVKGLSIFDNTKLSYYRGKRWLILIREVLLIPITIASVYKAKRKWPDVDIIHINEIPILWSIILAKIIFKKPIVVHSRSPQRNNPKSIRVKFVTNILNKYADAVVAIDKTVYYSLPPVFIPKQIIHNGFQSDSAIASLNDNLQTYFKNPKSKMQIGMVGNFYVMKGIYDFITAAKICKERGLDIDFFVVGENPRNNKGIITSFLNLFKFSPDIKSDLNRLVKEYNLESCFHIFGFTSNIKVVYDYMDINIFPSHINAVGRPVFEAAFSKVPSIVAIENPYDDAIIDKETGLCIKERNPVELSNAIEYCYKNPEVTKKMGQMAFELANKNYDISQNSLQMLKLYKQLLNKSK